MRICVFDTETGGIGAEAAQKWSIIQLGAVIWDDGLTTDQTFNVVIDEAKGGIVPSYHQEALDVNGFTPQRIQAEGVAPSVAAMRFVIWLTKQFPLGEKITLCGHNVGYDVSFLCRLFRLAGALPCYDDIFHYRAIDTASIGRFLIESGTVEPQSGASTGLFEYFRCSPDRPHDALSDAIATAQLYGRMLKLMADILNNGHLFIRPFPVEIGAGLELAK